MPTGQHTIGASSDSGLAQGSTNTNATRFKAYLGSAQNGNNTIVKLNIDTAQYDNNNELDSSAKRFVARTAGWYSVSAALLITSVQGGQVVLALYTNGVQTVTFGSSYGPAPVSATGGQVSGSALVLLAAGDYLELWFQAPATWQVNVGPIPTWLCVIKQP